MLITKARTVRKREGERGRVRLLQERIRTSQFFGNDKLFSLAAIIEKIDKFVYHATILVFLNRQIQSSQIQPFETFYPLLRRQKSLLLTFTQKSDIYSFSIIIY